MERSDRNDKGGELACGWPWLGTLSYARHCNAESFGGPLFDCETRSGAQVAKGKRKFGKRCRGC